MNKITRYILLFFLVTLTDLLFAQTDNITLKGIVTEKDGSTPIEFAQVTLRDKENGKILKFAVTTAKGEWKIAGWPWLEGCVLQVSMMGYESQVAALKQELTVYNFALKEQVTQLKEVVVKAPSIYQRGDTVKYIVSSFAQKQDKTLADVLKRMPGVEVADDGMIKYNGVAINKFYIEGKDMLGGRYSLASNSIHQKDVGSVEVMENHQPVRALQDISFSQNPAINVKLKENAKSRWAGSMNVGVGRSPWLWQGQAITMRFNKNTQTLNTYKTNNTGERVGREFTSFSLFEDNVLMSNYRLGSYIRTGMGSLPDLSESRSTFNQSHAVSTNNLYAFNSHTELTPQITYSSSRLNSDYTQQSTYLLPDSTIINDMSRHGMSHQHQLTADISFTSNSPTNYITNRLTANLRWNEAQTSQSGTYTNSQFANLSNSNVTNDFQLTRRRDNHVFTLKSTMQWLISPERITVERKDEIQRQRVNSSAFFSNTNTSLGRRIMNAYVSMNIGLITVMRSMDKRYPYILHHIGMKINC